MVSQRPTRNLLVKVATHDFKKWKLSWNSLRPTHSPLSPSQNDLATLLSFFGLGGSAQNISFLLRGGEDVTIGCNFFILKEKETGATLQLPPKCHFYYSLGIPPLFSCWSFSFEQLIPPSLALTERREAKVENVASKNKR